MFKYNNLPQNCDFLDAYSDGCVKFTSEQCFQTMSFKKPVIDYIKIWMFLNKISTCTVKVSSDGICLHGMLYTKVLE